jgi:sterol desaturase/sphingolipid hydroxylase (fatty acid hydroxylase superfamily)
MGYARGGFRVERDRMARTVLSWTIWPLSVAAIIAGVIGLADLDNPASIYAAMGRTALASTVVLLALELVLPYRVDWKWRGDRDLWRDIGHFVLYAQVGGLAAQLLFLAGLGSLLEPLALPSLWPKSSPIVVQVLLVMLLGDALEYWLHRLSHRVPALWRVHAIHHMPTRLHMLKAGRHHLLYFLLRGLLVWTPLLLLGAPAELVVWQFVAIAITGNVAHANIDLKIPKLAHRLLVTPQFHRIHHSADLREGNSNFGVMLPIWDMIFGTHIDPVKTEVRAMGIDGDPIPHRWLVELASPVRRLEVEPTRD